MAPPEIHKFDDLTSLEELFDHITSEFVCTTFCVIQPDDIVYMGQIFKQKTQISLDEFTKALKRVPDEEIYPKILAGCEFKAAPEDLPTNTYVKKPDVLSYFELKVQDALEIMPGQLLEEAKNIERVSSLTPHPGIVRYHGCVQKRGFITAIIYDRHISDLKTYISKGTEPPIDKEIFMHILTSAVKHLHSAGIAHNDITPGNILVNEAGRPVLADFDSCYPIGEKLTFNRGTRGWIENNDYDNYTTSEIQHDLYALQLLEEWLDQKLLFMSGA